MSGFWTTLPFDEAASRRRGGWPPVDLRAVCLVRAIEYGLSKSCMLKAGLELSSSCITTEERFEVVEMEDVVLIPQPQQCSRQPRKAATV